MMPRQGQPHATDVRSHLLKTIESLRIVYGIGRGFHLSPSRRQKVAGSNGSWERGHRPEVARTPPGYPEDGSRGFDLWDCKAPDLHHEAAEFKFIYRHEQPPRIF
jgi:hypothetical protein